MSSHPPPPLPALGIPRKRPYHYDSFSPSSSTWAPRYSSLSSSSPRSSSPPRTPYFSAHTYGHAHIRSSPELGPDVTFRGVGEHSEDPSMFWAHRHPIYAPAKYPSYTPQPSRYSVDHGYPPSSDFDVPDLAEEMEQDLPELDSEPTSDSTPGQSSGVYSDSEEEEEENSPEDEKDGFGYRFGYDSNRSTFFRTSAERGQWKTNPMPFRPVPPALLQTRRSAPTLSRVATPTVPLGTPPRTISEPAPSVTAENTDFVAQKSDTPDRATEAVSSNPSTSIPIIPPTEEEAQSSPILPSLTSDRESSLDINYNGMPSSPLPSSSPPMSHASFSVSRLSRSISPISYDREGSMMRSSSPLSELPDDEDVLGDEQETDIIPDVPDDKDLTTTTTAKDSSNSSGSTLLPDATQQSFESTPTDEAITHDQNHVESPAPTPPLTTEGNPSNAYPNSSSSSCEDAVIAISSPDPAPVSARGSPTPEDELIDIVNGTPIQVTSSKGKAKEMAADSEKSAALKDEDGASRSSPDVGVAPTEKRKKDGDAEGPATKKRKATPVGDTGSSSLARKRTKAENHENEDENMHDTEPAPPPARKQKKKKTEKESSVVPESAPSTSTTKRAAKPKRSKVRALSHYTDPEDDHRMELDTPLDPETRAQVCGLLIETMALSRASSLPISTLYKLVMQSQPALKTQRTEREWVRLFDRVLHAGETGSGGCGVFGKVESSGKDRADRPLEAQWFYVPEMDEDQERATLIRAMMPRPAKRSETKKYKQYYWRPVGKSTVWDPEE